MNENKKECKIIGYGVVNMKETGEIKLRVLMGIDSISDKYYGLMVAPPIFLDYDELMEHDLKRAIDDKAIKTYYVTTDNIISGKTKVSKIIVN